MIRNTLNGGGRMRGFNLYDTAGKLKLGLTNADISLFDIKDNAYLEGTTPDFSANSLTFTTNRKDPNSILFFKKNTPKSETTTETYMSENGMEFSVVKGVDVSKKQLVIWLANTGLGGNKLEIIAAVGYWQRTSRNWGATAGHTMNKYTWTFVAEKATTDEVILIQKSTNTFKGEVGYDDVLLPGEQDWLVQNPFTLDWDSDESIQQIITDAA